MAQVRHKKPAGISPQADFFLQTCKFVHNSYTQKQKPLKTKGFQGFWRRRRDLREVFCLFFSFFIKCRKPLKIKGFGFFVFRNCWRQKQKLLKIRTKFVHSYRGFLKDYRGSSPRVLPLWDKGENRYSTSSRSYCVPGGGRSLEC